VGDNQATNVQFHNKTHVLLDHGWNVHHTQCSLIRLLWLTKS